MIANRLSGRCPGVFARISGEVSAGEAKKECLVASLEMKNAADR